MRPSINWPSATGNLCQAAAAWDLVEDAGLDARENELLELYNAAEKAAADLRANQS